MAHEKCPFHTELCSKVRGYIALLKLCRFNIKGGKMNQNSSLANSQCHLENKMLSVTPMYILK